MSPLNRAQAAGASKARLITRLCVLRPIPSESSSINMLREARGLVSLACPLGQKGSLFDSQKSSTLAQLS